MAGAEGAGVADLNLGSMRNLSEVLARIPGGHDMWRLVARMGMWNSATHNAPEPLRAYPRAYSELEGTRLSDESAYWQSEKARCDEVIGVLTALRDRLRLLEKREQAAARGRVMSRESEREGEVEGLAKVKLTTTQIADKAALDPAVTDAQDVASMVELLLASASAHREAVITIVQGLSREVSYRSAMIQARVY